MPRFALTEEQQQLRDAAERFVRDRYPASSWPAISRSAQGFDERNWQDMAAMGWLAVLLPEAYDGLGLGLRECAVLMEAFGAGLVQEPYWSTAVLGACLVQSLGSEAQKRHMLPAIARGGLRLAFAAYEDGMRYALQEVQCRAEARADGGWELYGRKIAVLDAPCAHELLVLARTAQGQGLFRVRTDAAQVRLRSYRSLDERRCADIDFDGVVLAADAQLGLGPVDAAALQNVLDQAGVALGAESVGAMAMLQQLTVEYLKTRRQFGKALSEFQALRHRVADMVMALEQTRSLAAYAASADPADAAFPRLAAALKVQAGQAGRFVGESAVQLHGGIGTTDDVPIGHYLKRLITCDLLLGDSAHHLQRLA